MWLCPVLELLRYLFCYPDLLKGGVPLFKGKPQYTQYATKSTKTVKQLDMQLKRLGFEAGDIGSHSCRKGVATMVAAGCTVYLPIVALCIQAGWVLGGVKDKYLFRDRSSDQYVGRCDSCLDQLKKEFSFPHHI